VSVIVGDVMPEGDDPVIILTHLLRGAELWNSDTHKLVGRSNRPGHPRSRTRDFPSPNGGCLATTVGVSQPQRWVSGNIWQPLGKRWVSGNLNGGCLETSGNPSANGGCLATSTVGVWQPLAHGGITANLVPFVPDTNGTRLTVTSIKEKSWGGNIDSQNSMCTSECMMAFAIKP
jgi:hypothetical protein